MESPPKTAQGPTSLFQVYLRLRPPIDQQQNEAQSFKSGGYLTVEPPEQPTPGDDDVDSENTARVFPKYITVQAPNDSKKREKFAFTKVFQKEASQLEIFEETGIVSLMNGVLREGRDGLVATLGVTGSGKSHTILGSKTQRGITQMSLDVLFRSLGSTICSPEDIADPFLLHSLSASDPSEAQIFSTKALLESTYGDTNGERGRGSRAQTPMAPSRAQTPLVWNTFQFNSSPSSQRSYPSKVVYPALPHIPSPVEKTPASRMLRCIDPNRNARPSWNSPKPPILPSQLPFWNRHAKNVTKSSSRLKESSSSQNVPRRPHLPRPSSLPQHPDTSDYAIPVSPNDEHVVLISMYEVYNDRIFDLLSPTNGSSSSNHQSNNQKDRRRPLMFRSTGGSTDHKIVTGLRKVVCATYEEALMVLETGLIERRVAGTGSNSASSRSHGFFCVEVKKRIQDSRFGTDLWVGNSLTIVDLAGSERARNAKTAGATLAEAGKINESLMYLGRCLQMQSESKDGNKAIVPYRQCKLTELLFSNSFPSSNNHGTQSYQRNPQKAVMVVTADPLGDFNATSQILRYSALAREVTVPRPPSSASNIVHSHANPANRPPTRSKTSLQPVSAHELEVAALEIAHITDEYEALAERLAHEEIARADMEMKWRAVEERCTLIEQDVREECWAEMEEQMETERRRWQSAWDEQASQHDKHLDQKLDLLSRDFKIYEDPEPNAKERAAELERENGSLRHRIEQLERELYSRSPSKGSTRSKKSAMPGRYDSLDYSFNRSGSDVENVAGKLDRFHLQNNPAPSPTNRIGRSSGKPRKLTSRQWDLGPESMYED